MTSLRNQPRGPRNHKGEKRTEKVRATFSFSLLGRLDAACLQLSVCRSRALEMAAEMFADLVETGTVPTGPMEHWQRLKLADLESALALETAACAHVDRLRAGLLAAGAEILVAGVDARDEAERRAA